MSEMILFENKKLILFSDRITLKKASKTIYMCDIKSISYTKWSLKNYFLTYGDMETPGVFYIRLKGKFIFEKRIAFRVKYDKAKEIISKIKFKVDFKE
jgi:hypothetical protein